MNITRIFFMFGIGLVTLIIITTISVEVYDNELTLQDCLMQQEGEGKYHVPDNCLSDDQIKCREICKPQKWEIFYGTGFSHSVQCVCGEEK